MEKKLSSASSSKIISGWFTEAKIEISVLLYPL